MKKYLNTKFYNVTLPILLALAVFTTAILGVVLGSDIILLLSIILIVSFKAIHQRLEALSLEQRVDNGLINKNGVYYPGSLSDVDEDEVKEIGKHWSQNTCKGTTLKEVLTDAIFGEKK